METYYLWMQCFGKHQSTRIQFGVQLLPAQIAQYFLRWLRLLCCSIHPTEGDFLVTYVQYLSLYAPRYLQYDISRWVTESGRFLSNWHDWTEPFHCIVHLEPSDNRLGQWTLVKDSLGLFPLVERCKPREGNQRTQLNMEAGSADSLTIRLYSSFLQFYSSGVIMTGWGEDRMLQRPRPIRNPRPFETFDQSDRETWPDQ